jgi:N-acetylmuramic acid 6-phosphate (MurNAc-6-P) etherase
MIQRSITETPNPLTLNIDLADPVGMIRLLRQSDAQLFAGYDTWASLMDEEIIEKLALFGWRIARLLKDPDNRIFLSGAGTSGRFAHLHCLEFNRLLRERRLPEIFRPLIAGGEAALIQAQESAEDSAAAAVRDLTAALHEDLNRGLYIGITAGVSAPYVAAQVDYLGGNPAFESVVVGFNPPQLARDKPIEGWDKTVKQVIDQALESERFILMNPVYGPEAITGSTRMKGGTMTKIVIEVAFATALEILEYNSQPGVDPLTESTLLPVRASILERIRRLQETVNAAYGNVADLAEIVRSAGTALRSSGRIHYLGRGMAALLGIIDASECPPTYGADPTDVRAYIREGWEFLGYNPAAMKARGKSYEIDHEYFETQILPEISRGDLVIGIAIQTLGENTRRLLEEAARRKANTALIIVSTIRPKTDTLPAGLRHFCPIDVPTLGFLPNTTNEAELALKLCLNAITTGAHVMAGKVYTNVMIDLRISNSKLYDRAVGLVCQLSGADQETARKALHQAIFREEPTAAAMEKYTMQMIIARAMTRRRVIALAILLATGRFTFEAASERLESEPRVRRIIEEAIAGA